MKTVIGIALGILFCSSSLLFTVSSAANQNPAYTLRELNQMIEAATLMTHLDEVDAYIDHPNRCGEKSKKVRALQSALKSLKHKLLKKSISYSEYDKDYDTTKKLEHDANNDFEDCFSSYLRALLSDYPDIADLRINSWRGLDDKYEALQERYFPGGHPEIELFKLKNARNKFLLNSPERVAVIKRLRGPVHIESVVIGDRIKAAKKDVLYVGDVIETGPRGVVRVEFLESYYKGAYAPPLIFVFDSNTKFRFGEFQADKPKKKTRMEMIYGLMRAVSRVLSLGAETPMPPWDRLGKPWGGKLQFSIRHGGSTCSLGDSDVEITHDPVAKKTRYRVHGGEVYIRTPHESFELQQGSEVVVTDGRAGTIRQKRSDPPL